MHQILFKAFVWKQQVIYLQIFLLEQGDKPEKGGGGGWYRNGGCPFFITLQFSSTTFNVCVGGGVRFPLYLSDLQSFELAIQDSHPSL